MSGSAAQIERLLRGQDQIDLPLSLCRMERISAAAPERLLFLPGASGNTSFWRPVAERLTHPAQPFHLGWPGFGDTAADPGVYGWLDLLELVLSQMDRPCALIAQSMGGVLAVQAAGLSSQPPPRGCARSLSQR